MSPFRVLPFDAPFSTEVSPSRFDLPLSTWLLPGHGSPPPPPLLFIPFSIFFSFSLTNEFFSFRRCSHTLFLCPRVFSLHPLPLLLLPSHRCSIPSSVSGAVINLAGGIPEGYLTLIYELAILYVRPRIFSSLSLLLPLLFPRSLLVPRDKRARKRRPPRRAPVSRRTFIRRTRHSRDSIKFPGAKHDLAKRDSQSAFNLRSAAAAYTRHSENSTAP